MGFDKLENYKPSHHKGEIIQRKSFGQKKKISENSYCSLSNFFVDEIITMDLKITSVSNISVFFLAAE